MSVSCVCIYPVLEAQADSLHSLTSQRLWFSNGAWAGRGRKGKRRVKRCRERQRGVERGREVKAEEGSRVTHLEAVLMSSV